jgi:membrane associated rhomboid family serine protease
MTLLIIILTTLISLAGFYNSELTSKFIFDPYQIHHRKEWWRFITSGFLHADFLHLFINMFVLYSFGQAVEYYYAIAFGTKGQWLYLALYLSSLIASSISTYEKNKNNVGYRSLGASGAVSAVVFTTILFNPYSKIYLYGIIGLPGIVMGIAYLVYSYYMSKKEVGDHINHEAHFYGAVFGMAFTILYKPSLFLVFVKHLFLLA